MIIDQLPSLVSPQSGDEFPVERGTNTYKIDYNALATAIINKLGGDPVTVAHGGTGSSSASGARTNLSVYSKSETNNAITQATSLIPVANGGTGATTAAAAKENLGLGSETNNFRLSTPTSSNQLLYLRFVCTNSNSAYSGHELLFMIRSDGVSLYDNTAAATVWSLT